ncbi:MAG: glycosyltransferase [Chitinivibrionales bacterium]|nr:glycosyltransferase [Chitinivibrionales bacterium]MBD3358788.1 glycosyltransferase [Chitinivibrionales bacterium]
MEIVFLGLSITSSWGNGHATTYRSLIHALSKQGHCVRFLERDKPWYKTNRDLPNPHFCRAALYDSLDDLDRRFRSTVAKADLVVVGSYVPEGIAVGSWALEHAEGVVAFYDIDTPVTIAKLKTGNCEYITPALIRAYNIYFSFSGGRVLDILEKDYGSPKALPLYCSVDPDHYYPEDLSKEYAFGYMGTYSPDRQRGLENLLLIPAHLLPNTKFVVAGPQYPESILWPENVHRIDHVPPARHRHFYNCQSITLNLTRSDMMAAGYSPSVRLFEAAACGVPIVSDYWEGLEDFFVPDEEILVAHTSKDIIQYLVEFDEEHRRRIGQKAEERIHAAHTSHIRARQLVAYALDGY